MVSSPLASEEASHPHADHLEAFQVETPALPAAHPGSRLLQEAPGIPGTPNPRPHRLLQAVQAEPAIELRQLRRWWTQQLLRSATTQSAPVLAGWSWRRRKLLWRVGVTNGKSEFRCSFHFP